MLILVLNCGSSSVKYQLYDMPGEFCLGKGLVEKIGGPCAFLNHYPNNKPAQQMQVKALNHTAAIKLIVQELLDERFGVIRSINEINAIGHRVVHGGEKFKQSALINKNVIKALKQYSKLAPLHNPPNLAGIYACKRLLPHLSQVAVFDTAFHQTMPDFAFVYGLPYEIYKRLGIRRYGFHGTSHRYVALRASQILGKPQAALKIISCHLGNGCSITAVNKGKSVDTSMGFTPLEGLVMGTRSGDIDPAAVLYLMKKKGLSIDATEKLLNKASGLLGLSGKSNDMRDITRLARSGNHRARLAREVFIYRVKKYIGSYLAVMDGCDALIFTAGIGENNRYIRKKISQGMACLLKKFNTRILVIPTNEELMIARDTYRLVN